MDLTPGRRADRRDHSGEHRGLCEALEPRKLLASTFTGTDVDGDVYLVEVTGNGSAAVTTSGGGVTGFITNLVLSGTDLKSVLKITLTATPGNGEVQLENLTGGDLGVFEGTRLDDRPGGVWTLGQAKTINVRTIDDVTFNINGPAAQKVSIKMGFFGNAILHSTQRVGTLDVGSAVGGEMNLDEGVDSIISFGDFVTDFNVIGPANLSIVKAQIGGELNNDWDVSGGVGLVTALSVGGGFDLNGATFVNTFKVTEQFGGQLRADRMGTIVGLVDASVELFLGAGNLAGIALQTLKIGGAFTGKVVAENPGIPAGAIKTVAVGSLSSPQFKVSGIDNLTCVGDAAGLVIDTTAGTRAVSLGTVKIGGTVTGSAQVVGRVNSFTALKSSGFSLVDPAFAAAVGSIKFTSTDQSVIQVVAGTLGELRCAGTLTGGLDLRGEFGATGLSMRTLRTARISGFTVPNSTVGGLNALIANKVESFTMTWAFINSISVRAVAGDPILDGSVSSGSMTLTDTRPGSALSLGSYQITGGFFSTTWSVFGGVGTMRNARMTGMTFVARFINSLTIGGTPGTVVFGSALLQLTGVNASGTSLGTAQFKGSLESATVNIAGHVGSIGFNKILGTSIDLGSVGTWKVLPGNGFDGSTQSGNMRINQPGANGFSVGDMTFDRVGNFSIESKGSVKSFTASAINNLTLVAGDFPSAFNVFTGFTPLSGPARRINSIKITRAFDVLNPAVQASLVVTHAIGSLKINGFVQANNGGTDFGLAAGIFGPITMRDNLGALFSPVAVVAPGQVKPVGLDFVIRSVV